MPTMKESGIPWIGKMPITWSLSKLKYKATVQAGYPFDSSLFSLTEGTPLIRIRDITSGQISTFYMGKYPEEYLVQSGDILVGMDGDFNVRYWENDKALLNQRCCRIINNAEIDKKYIYYCLPYDLKRINDITYSTTVKHLSNSTIENIYLPIPTLSEQQAIVAYLDDRCSKIDEIITEAEKSIEEYKELKQAVISEAVTKGLDKNVPMKKTNNIWIPSLPADVPLSRVSRHYSIILGKMLCPNKRDENDTLEPYYCAANVHFDGISGELKQMWFNASEKAAYEVHEKDMLIVEGGAGAGGAAIVMNEPEQPTFVQNSIMIVRSKDSDDNRYLCYLVQALVKNKYVDFVCNKATIPHFTKEKVSGIPYPVWNKEKRTEIADYLDNRIMQIDDLISEKQSLIEDLKAYKKSLIYEVVTGKRRIS